MNRIVLNPYFLCFIFIYVGNLLLMNYLKVFPIEEAIGVVLVFGVFLSGVAWVISRNIKHTNEIKPIQSNEAWLVVGLIVYIFILLLVGNNIFPFLGEATGWIKEIVTLFRKVLIFVAIPFLIYRFAFGFSTSDFGLVPVKQLLQRRTIWITIIMCLLLAALNYFAGSGAKPLREGVFSWQQLTIGMPIFFIWLLVEVGLVEEFFFRGFLQNRLSVLMRSEIGAVFTTAIIFGLVHAPGMYLRGAGVIEGLGQNPSLLASIGYCIAIQTVPAFFFGIIWLRTRNLWILMTIHAITDLISNFGDMANIWGI